MFRKNFTYKKLILTMLLLSASSYAQEIYTVDQLVLKALEISPDLKISSSKYESSKNRYNEEFSNYLPDVNLNAGAGMLGISNIFEGKPDEINTGTAILGSLSLKQLVYDFGQTGGATDSAQYSSDAYLSDYEQLVSNKKKDVKSAYYNVLKAKSLIKVNIENVKLNKAQLYRSQKYFKAGIRTKIDVSDAKVELIQSKLGLNDANYNLKLAYANLDKVIGYTNPNRDYKVFYQALDIFNMNINLQAYSLNLNDAIEFSYLNRYVIKKQTKLIAAARAKEKVSSSEYYPRAFIDAEYSYQDIGEELSVVTPKIQYSALVNLNWNLYTGGASSARNEIQKIQTSISTSELMLSKLLVKTDVTNAYINLNSVKDSVVLSKSLLEASKEKFEQAGQRYEHGLSDYIELQQARQGYIDAAGTLINNYYNYFDAMAILDNAIGK